MYALAEKVQSSKMGEHIVVVVKLNVPCWSSTSEYEHRSPHNKILLLFSAAFYIGFMLRRRN